MKVLVVLCAVAAVAVAKPGYLGVGLPADTPEVAAAKAAHLATVAQEAARNTAGVYGGVVAAVPLTYAGPLADSVPAGLAGLTAQGVPVDTPSVAAAKAANAAAHARAFVGPVVAGPAVYAAAPVAVAGPLADSVPAGLAGLTAQGVPVDTPAVAAAKAANAAAHLQAKGYVLA